MDRANRGFELQKVINNDYCIGCGACTAVRNSPVKMVLNGNGQYQAQVDPEYVDDEITYRLDAVCPFTNVSENENELSADLFGELPGLNQKIGCYDRLYAGFVKEEGYRDKGSSGGMGSWICVELLNSGHIDEVIHIKGDNEKKFKYSVSATSSVQLLVKESQLVTRMGL